VLVGLPKLLIQSFYLSAQLSYHFVSRIIIDSRLVGDVRGLGGIGECGDILI
jgi:hypothetical protein